MNSRYDREPKVAVWKRRVARGGCTLRCMKPLHVVKRRNGELLFGMFETRVVAPGGRRLLPIVLIRGDACVIVPLVKNRRTGRERFVMVGQHRIGSGGWSVEFPAGMLDRRTADALAVAIEELAEETGLVVRRSQVRPLWRRELFSSPGLQDEAIHYYGCRLTLDDSQYRSLHGRRMGHTAEGENIVVTLATRTQGERLAGSAQVLLGFYLFERAFGAAGSTGSRV